MDTDLLKAAKRHAELAWRDYHGWSISLIAQGLREVISHLEAQAAQETVTPRWGNHPMFRASDPPATPRPACSHSNREIIGVWWEEWHGPHSPAGVTLTCRCGQRWTFTRPAWLPQPAAPQQTDG